MNIQIEAYRYLSDHPELKQPVMDVAIAIAGTADYVTGVNVELYHDLDEGWDKIFICCSTDFGDDDMEELLNAEEEIFDEFFLPVIKTFDGKVVLSLT